MTTSGANGRPDEAARQRALAFALAEALDLHFERFVTAYQHRLFGFVLTLVANSNEAEEIAQDAFVSAYHALRGYDAARIRSLSLRAWLFTIALNKVRNRARRLPAVPLDEARRDGYDPAGDFADLPEFVFERDERIAAVRQALDALEPRYRLPVLLRHIEGFGYGEIAQMLGQPAGTAKSNVHRGLELLRTSNHLSEVR